LWRCPRFRSVGEKKEIEDATHRGTAFAFDEFAFSKRPTN
jgi:hypothetical protein